MSRTAGEIGKNPMKSWHGAAWRGKGKQNEKEQIKFK